MATTLQQLYYKVYLYDSSTGEWSYNYSNPNWQNNSDLFFGQNLLEGTSTSKISIQAPAGTTIQLNNKTIIIGRSGIYDFDNDDIEINSLIFPRPKKYERTAIDENKKAAVESILDEIRVDLATGNYEQFCQNEEYIYLEKEYTRTYTKLPEEGSNDDPEVVTITVNGFAEAAPLYLQVLQGEPKEVDSDLENIIVNYLTT